MAQVLLTPQAEKDFNRLPQKHKERVKKKLAILENNPLAGKGLTGRLRGLYSLRIWPYRAIYVFEKKKVWLVHLVHRQGAYRK